MHRVSQRRYEELLRHFGGRLPVHVYWAPGLLSWRLSRSLRQRGHKVALKLQEVPWQDS